MWAGGEAYERYMGRWSAAVGRAFLEWLDPSPGLVWLDVGCGTGALTRGILARAAPAAVLAVDPSDAFVDQARSATDDPRARFELGTAEELSFEAGKFDVVVSGLVLNFVPNPSAGVLEMERVCKAGGMLAAYVWDYDGEMQFLRRFWDAVAEVVPGGEGADEREGSAICNPESLARLVEEAGLQEVRVDALEIQTRFESFDDYWSPFLAEQGPAPAYVMSLDEESREALREYLERTLPRESDGSIALTARAWAVRGAALAHVLRG